MQTFLLHILKTRIKQNKSKRCKEGPQKTKPFIFR